MREDFISMRMSSLTFFTHCYLELSSEVDLIYLIICTYVMYLDTIMIYVCIYTVVGGR